MIDKTKNYKIDVSMLDTGERIKLQKELFKMGYQWFEGIRNVSELDSNFLFLCDDMDLSRCRTREYFDRADNTLITVSDIMTQPEERTLRDWFAGQALNGMLPSDSEPLEIIAHDAYRYADAMLKERNK